MTTDEYLKHHGINGQKWGIKNGPPYPLDKSDYSASEKKANNISSSSNRKSKSKQATKPLTTAEKYKKMSDDELKARIARMQLEKSAIDLDKQINAVSKQNKSFAISFVQDFSKKAGEGISNATKTVVQQYLEKELRKRLGLNTVNETEALKKEYTKLNYKKLIRNLKKELGDDA